MVINIEDDVRKILAELPSETSYLDYKVKPYNKETKSDFVKDVVAMLNSLENVGKQAYIIFGVSDKKELRGVEPGEQMDDSCFQSWADCISPRPELHTGTLTYEKRLFGYIYIPLRTDNCVYEANETIIPSKGVLYEKHAVFKGQAFIRHGSQNRVMSEKDRTELRLLRFNESIEQANISQRNDDTLDEILTVCVIIESWNSGCKGDQEVIQILYGDYTLFERDLRKICIKNHELFEHYKAEWKLRNRKVFLSRCLSSIDDEIVRKIRLATESVLDNINGAYFHSKELTKGLLSFIAYAMNNCGKLSRATESELRYTSYILFEKLFTGMSHRKWGFIDDQSILIASIDPEGFLKKIDAAITNRNALFAEYLSTRYSGKKYLYDGNIRYALVSLSMYSEFFPQSAKALFAIGIVCSEFLGALTTILIPWFPQTEASSQKRIGLIKALLKYNSVQAWKIIIKLLDVDNATVVLNNKIPFYREAIIPTEGQTKSAYETEVSKLLEMACQYAECNVDRLCDLLPIYDVFAIPGRERIVSAIENSINSINKNSKERLWNALEDFLSKHRRYADADWALSEEQLKPLVGLSANILVQLPNVYNRRLFQKEQWELLEKPKKLDQSMKVLLCKQQAVAKRVYLEGLEATKKFVKTIDLPDVFGKALAGAVQGKDVLPSEMIKLLSSRSLKLRSMAEAFISEGFFMQKTKFYHQVEFIPQTRTAIRIYSLVPVTEHIVFFIEKCSLTNQNYYWSNVTSQFPDEIGQKTFEVMTRRLFDVGRFKEALRGLHVYVSVFNRRIGAIFIYNFLMDYSKKVGVSYESEYIPDLIKYVQKSSVSSEKKCILECTFWRNSQKNSGYIPNETFFQLNLKPELFIEILEIGFSDEKSNAYWGRQWDATSVKGLLSEWKITPGTERNGSFSEKKFIQWVQKVIVLADSHLIRKQAEKQIGRLLYYAPEDKGGFFVNESVAEFIDQEENVTIRDAYRDEACDSWNGHVIYADGTTSFTLEEIFQERSDQALEKGFLRLGQVLQDVARQYHNEAIFVQDVAQRHKVKNELDE